MTEKRLSTPALPNPFYEVDEEVLSEINKPEASDYFPNHHRPTSDILRGFVKFNIKGEREGDNNLTAIVDKIKTFSLLLGGEKGCMDRWSEKLFAIIKEMNAAELEFIVGSTSGKAEKELTHKILENFRNLFRLQAELLFMEGLEQIATEKICPTREAENESYDLACRYIGLLLIFLNQTLENYIYAKKELYLSKFSSKKGVADQKNRNLSKAHKREFAKVFDTSKEA